jgi:hypothetical protein
MIELEDDLFVSRITAMGQVRTATAAAFRILAFVWKMTGFIKHNSIEGCDCHRGRDGTNVEDDSVRQQDEVFESINSLRESVARHLAQSP